MERSLRAECFRNLEALDSGLTQEMLCGGADEVYRVLDVIDAKLAESDSRRLTELIELANLSSIIGNLFAGGIVRAADGVFERPATGHKYQDLRTTALDPRAQNIEIKVALEGNNPKGHLAKAGPYLTCRYSLGDADGRLTPGTRGNVVWIWELRFGHLLPEHFNLSNTSGDSGKTAVVNKGGMETLTVVYFDPDLCPFPLKGRRRSAYDVPALLDDLFEQTVTKADDDT